MSADECSKGVFAFEAEDDSVWAPVMGEARAVKQSYARRWRLPVCAVLGMATGVLLVVAFSRQAPGTARVGDDAGAEALVSLLMKTKPKLPLPYECSKSVVQNCHISQCCLDFGHQCYSKNETYAACLKTCKKDALMKKGNGSWSCNKLGLERRCAKAEENCADFGCCAVAGHQCYTKNKYWAQCMYTCDPAHVSKDFLQRGNWSCDPIGPRYTPYYRIDYSPGYENKTLVEPWVKNCSHIGESCAKTKCCAWTGYQCYEKNESWASCLSACIPKKANGGISEKPKVQKGKPLSNPPSHWKATFTHADPGPWSCKRLSVPETPAYIDGVSLFCYTTAMDNHGKSQTHDFELLKVQQKANTFIFACDHWVVFSDKDAKLNPGRTVVVDYPKLMRRPNNKLWVNTPFFLNIWKSIKQEGTWKSYPWIVKADPYTVFIPQRLQYILRHQPIPATGAYMENCKHVRMGFHGSLEVASRDAFGTFLDHLDSCQTELPIKNGTHTHFRYYGEDKFIAWCMHRHGVGRIPSRQEIRTVPENQHIFGLHLTRTCPDHRAKEITDSNSKKKKWWPNCSRALTAGLHGFKKPLEYMKCLHETIQAQKEMEK